MVLRREKTNARPNESIWTKQKTSRFASPQCAALSQPYVMRESHFRCQQDFMSRRPSGQGLRFRRRLQSQQINLKDDANKQQRRVDQIDKAESRCDDSRALFRLDLSS